MADNNPPAERTDSRLMRGMFHTVAPRYDFITRAFSYGMDRNWKRLSILDANLPKNAVVLDLASGTGDYSRMVREARPDAQCVAVDITERMLRLARVRNVSDAACADAARLPFPNATFDCVFVGYGLRNFPNLAGAVKEIARVTKPGGRLASLDFYLPQNALWRSVYIGYLYAQGTFWGLVLHGRPRVYTYIPHSLRNFVSVGEFSDLLRKSGYGDVEEREFILGGIGLHWSVRR